jgi:hypothetical protein
VALSDCRGHAHGPNRSCTPGEMRWPSGGVRLPSYPHHFISLFGVRPCCCSWLDHAVRDRFSRPHVDSWAVKFTGRQIHGPSNSWAGKIHVVNGSTQGGSQRGVRGWCADPPMRPASVAPIATIGARNCDAPSISAEQDGAWVGGLTDPMLAKGGGARRRSWHGGRRQMSRRP